jgi:glycerol-3-phosphate responsive antiterminator
MLKQQIAEATKEYEKAKHYLKSKQDTLFLLNVELNKLKEKKQKSN